MTCLQHHGQGHCGGRQRWAGHGRVPLSLPPAGLRLAPPRHVHTVPREKQFGAALFLCLGSLHLGTSRGPPTRGAVDGGCHLSPGQRTGFLFGDLLSVHLWAHSVFGPRPASQTPPAAGWPGQVQGAGSAEAKTTGCTLDCGAPTPGCHALGLRRHGLSALLPLCAGGCSGL